MLLSKLAYLLAVSKIRLAHLRTIWSPHKAPGISPLGGFVLTGARSYATLP